MKRFFAYLSLSTTLFFCGVPYAKADAFSQVPKGSPLYVQLSVIKNAVWESDVDISDQAAQKAHAQNSNSELTRYEFAIDVAKAAIDFNAHLSADKDWLATVPRPELRALRALALEFEPELVEFKVDTQRIVRNVDEVLRSPAVKDQKHAEQGSETKNPSLKLSQSADMPPVLLREFPLVSSLNLKDMQEPQINLSLSDKLKLYGNISSPALLRQAETSAAKPGARAMLNTGDKAVAENTAVSAGANMDVNDWLSLRADYAFNRQAYPLSLQQTLNGQKYFNPWFPETGSTRSFGGGVDVRVAPSLTLSGGISRLSLNRYGLQNDISGTQLEGGVGVSGLSNRLLLSASLARLMPDDPASFDSTAARLNLDFAVSNNLSLNLLYQQMFSLSAQNENKSTFAGGVNIHF